MSIISLLNDLQSAFESAAEAQAKLETTPEWSALTVAEQSVSLCKDKIRKAAKFLGSDVQHHTYKAETGSAKLVYTSGSLDAGLLSQLAASLGATPEQIAACKRSGYWQVKK